MASDPIASRGVVDWIFFLLSATIVWQLNLPQFFGTWIQAFGAKSGSPLYHVFADIFPPVILVMVAWISVFVYERMLWPRLPQSNYSNGWWVYGLTAYGENENPTKVVGHFFIQHEPDSIGIPEGKAYIVEGGEITEERGSWSSQTIWVNDQTVKIMFNLKAVNESGLPENYEGLIDMNQTMAEQLIGNKSYRGQFYDLDRGEMVLGNIYAERLSTKNSYTSEEVQGLLNKHSSKLVSRSRPGEHVSS